MKNLAKGIPDWHSMVNQNFEEVSEALSEKAKQFDLNTTNANLAQLSNPNLLINGDFQISQRTAKDGTKVFKYGGADGTNIYTVDRWQAIQSANGITCTIDSRLQATKRFLAVENFNSSGQVFAIQQVLESGTLNYGKNTLSFEYLTSTMNLTASIKDKATGATIATTTLLLNSAFTKKQITFDITDMTKQYVIIFFTDTQTYSSTSFYLSNVKLELGDKATPFVPRLYAEELALCQRYYEASDMFCVGIATNYGGNETATYQTFKVFKRTTPTITIWSQDSILNNINVYGSLVKYVVASVGTDKNGILCIRTTMAPAVGTNMVFKYAADAEIY